jgi:hypothetical protein
MTWENDSPPSNHCRASDETTGEVLMNEADDTILRVMFEDRTGKNWEDATEEERQKQRDTLAELRAILVAPWPTHLPGKIRH